MSGKLSGYICLVTGASRGLGKAIAVALGEAGATVYITGRTVDCSSNGSEHYTSGLKETARLIEAAGGKAIAVAVDHSDDSQVAGLFARIRREQCGRLDVLVNNAFSASSYLVAEASLDTVYWEPMTTLRSPSEEWDLINRVGLRNAYTCCVLATRMMVECRSNMNAGSCHTSTLENNVNEKACLKSVMSNPLPTGVIVNISSYGGMERIFNVAFCAGKSALDRMSMEMARDLKKRGVDVAVLSLLPGLVKTETLVAALESGQVPQLLSTAMNAGLGLPPEVPGRVVANLVGQSRAALINQSGRCLFGEELARQFAIKLPNRRYPLSRRAVKTILLMAGWTRLACLVPSFVKIPRHLAKYKIHVSYGSRRALVRCMKSDPLARAMFAHEDLSKFWWAQEIQHVIRLTKMAERDLGSIREAR
ncbi:oxidoreductase, short chain dehydrogenase/reductase family protein, partial [Opisthorchis viverrini]